MVVSDLRVSKFLACIKVYSVAKFAFSVLKTLRTTVYETCAETECLQVKMDLILFVAGDEAPTERQQRTDTRTYCC